MSEPAAEKPSTIAATAPSDAPLETPIRPGSASGLRKTPWSAAPAIASPPPTRIPSTTRGEPDRPEHGVLVEPVGDAEVDPGVPGEDRDAPARARSGARRGRPRAARRRRAAPRAPAGARPAASRRGTARRTRPPRAALAVAVRGSCSAELRVQAAHERAQRRAGPRAEPEQEQVVVGEHAPVAPGRRLRDAGDPQRAVRRRRSTRARRRGTGARPAARRRAPRR